MNKQESQYKVVNNFLIYKELGSDALGMNFRAGEVVPDERKANNHVLLTEAYPFLIRNPNVWKKVNILVEGVRKSNISKLFSPDKIVQEGEKFYLVYPLLRGKTFEQVLDDSIQKDIPLNFDLAFSIVFAIADLIDIGSSIVVSGEKSFHGLLTPDNILIDYDGKVMLKNYGIYPYLSKDEEIMSELEKKYGAWIAPELLRKEKPVAQTDIYHLGYLIYRVLTGKYFSCGKDEDFDSKFSNISFTQHIPSSDKEFLTNIITFFKKTLHSQPSRRFANIKEFKDFISAQFHIEELSSITFNLAYFMNSLYLEYMEEENKVLAKELTYIIPEPPKEVPPAPAAGNDHLVEDILSGLEKEKKSRTKLIIPFVLIILVIVAVSIYFYLEQQKKARQQQEELQTQSQEAYKRSMEKFKEDLNKQYQEELKKISERTVTSESDKKKQEEELNNLKEWKKEEERKATEKQKAEEARIKKENEDIARAQKEKEDRETQQKAEDARKAEEARQQEEQRKKEAQKKSLEESQKVVEGQVISLTECTEKPRKVKGDNPTFPLSVQKKFAGSNITLRVTVLIDENGNVVDIRNLTKTSSDIESAIIKTIKKWKYSPAKKDNIKVKVWFPFEVNVSL